MFNEMARASDLPSRPGSALSFIPVSGLLGEAIVLVLRCNRANDCPISTYWSLATSLLCEAVRGS